MCHSGRLEAAMQRGHLEGGPRWSAWHVGSVVLGICPRGNHRDEDIMFVSMT